MRYRTFAIAAFLFFIPLGKIYGSSQNINSALKASRTNEANLISHFFKKIKTADDYLDKAELIIKDDNFTPLLDNDEGVQDEFIRLVNQSLKLKESARAYLYLGFSRHMAFDSDSYKDSVDYYEKAIELKPKYIRALIALSSTHLNGKNYKECINSANQVLKIDQANESAQELRKNCKSSLKQQNLNE